MMNAELFAIHKSILLHSGISILRKALKEIIIQNIADFQQQIGVNPSAVENLVSVLPRATELLGQPCDTASLLDQFGFDNFPNMWFFVHRFAFAGALRDGKTKWAEPLLLTRLEGIGKRPDEDKQNSPRPNDVSLSPTYPLLLNFADFSRQRIRA